MVDPTTIATIGAAIGLSPAASKLLERVFGPSADEFGDMLRKKLSARRTRVFEKAATALEAAEIEPKEVAAKLLAPIVEHSALEDDESLGERWAALLANAAWGDGPAIRPIYLQTLANLTPQDAMLLDHLYDLSVFHMPGFYGGRQFGIDTSSLSVKLDLDSGGFEESMNTLIACGLIERMMPRGPDEDGSPAFGRSRSTTLRGIFIKTKGEDDRQIFLTLLGARFVEACQLPGPSSDLADEPSSQ